MHRDRGPGLVVFQPAFLVAYYGEILLILGFFATEAVAAIYGAEDSPPSTPS